MPGQGDVTMTRPDLDRLLEKAVAEAIGVPYRTKSTKRPHRSRSPAGNPPVHAKHNERELQHA
jgi:hypothetical protein